MQVEVLGQELRKAPAEACDPLGGVTDQTDRLLELPLGERCERLAQRRTAHLLRRLDQFGGGGVRADHRRQGQRRGVTRLHLLAQRLLEVPVAVEAEPGDEPHHGGCTDAGLGGEPRGGLQPGCRVIGRQRPRDLPLGRRQVPLGPPHPLGHGRPRAGVPFRRLRVRAVLRVVAVLCGPTSHARPLSGLRDATIVTQPGNRGPRWTMGVSGPAVLSVRGFGAVIRPGRGLPAPPHPSVRRCAGAYARLLACAYGSRPSDLRESPFSARVPPLR